MSLAELELQRGNLELAGDHATSAIDLADTAREPANAGYGQELLARIAAASSNHQAADRAFEAAIRLLERAGAPERLIETHSNYARELEARGEMKKALEHSKAALALTRPREDTSLDRGAATIG